MTLLLSLRPKPGQYAAARYATKTLERASRLTLRAPVWPHMVNVRLMCVSNSYGRRSAEQPAAPKTGEDRLHRNAGKQYAEHTHQHALRGNPQ